MEKSEKILGRSPTALPLKRPGSQPGEPVSPKARDLNMPPEIGGPEGPEPTRYGDWERKGRCIDF